MEQLDVLLECGFAKKASVEGGLQFPNNLDSKGVYKWVESGLPQASCELGTLVPFMDETTVLLLTVKNQKFILGGKLPDSVDLSNATVGKSKGWQDCIL